MLTFSRHSKLSSGSALPAAPGPAGAFSIGPETGRGRSDSDTIFMLDFLHDECALYRTDVLVPSEHIQQELLVGVHVWSLDSEQVVETTGDVVPWIPRSPLAAIRSS